MLVIPLLPATLLWLWDVLRRRSRKLAFGSFSECGSGSNGDGYSIFGSAFRIRGDGGIGMKCGEWPSPLSPYGPSFVVGCVP